MNITEKSVPLPTLAVQINEHCHAAIVHANAAVEQAWYAGQKLLAAKKQVQHGEWKSWLEANIKTSYRQCAKYMQLASSYSLATLSGQLTINNAIEALRPEQLTATESGAEEVVVEEAVDDGADIAGKPDDGSKDGDSPAAFDALIAECDRRDAMPKLDLDEPGLSVEERSARRVQAARDVLACLNLSYRAMHVLRRMWLKYGTEILELRVIVKDNAQWKELLDGIEEGTREDAIWMVFNWERIDKLKWKLGGCRPTEVREEVLWWEANEQS